MSHALKTNLVESNTYSLNPEYVPMKIWILGSPDGPDHTREYVNFRSMLNDCIGTDIHETAEGEYISEKEGRYSEEDAEDYYWEHFERIAESLGYEIRKVVR